MVLPCVIVGDWLYLVSLSLIGLSCVVVIDWSYFESLSVIGLSCVVVSDWSYLVSLSVIGLTLCRCQWLVYLVSLSLICLTLWKLKVNRRVSSFVGVFIRLIKGPPSSTVNKVTNQMLQIMKWSQIHRRIELCMKEIILRFKMNL
jgi:hypothetical protein